MANREKVFDALRNCVTEPKCKDCPWEDCEEIGCKRVTVPITLLLDTLNLLKEQEPVHAQKREFASMWFWCCGSCGVAITEGDKFCRNCGKKVKWDG